MTIIAFDLEILNERGSTVAAYDYARAAKKYGHIEPLFLYRDMEGERPEHVLARLSRSFETVKYNSRSEMLSIIKTTKADIYYKLIIKPEIPERVPLIFNASHAVFDFDKPFGDAWAYISLWLARYTSGPRYDFVPHIVDMPCPDGDLRSSLGIPQDALVLARYGGYDQFDIPAVHRAILDVLEKRKDIYFLFANTKPFGIHPRIIYLPTIYTVEEKARFIATCDWMLHGRYRGESFGLAMAEFLALDCPVLCWSGGWDRNHLTMQPNKNFIYTSYGHLFRMLLSLQRKDRPSDVSRTVREFSPQNVWKKWQSVFLNTSNPRPLARIPQYRNRLRYLRMRYHQAICSLYTRAARVSNF